jgi:hypothetical protein
MKKKLKHGFLALFLLIVLVSLVSSKLFWENSNYYVEQDLKKGWNLIAGISFSEEVPSGSELKIAHLWKAYFYDAKTKKDVEIRPNYNAGSIEPLELFRNAFWVYSIKNGRIKYKVSSSFANKSRVGGYYQFYSGKNLIAINEEMYGKTINELKGDCTINNARFWNAGIQNWTELNLNAKLDFESRDLLIGKGISIDVLEDCGFMNEEKISYLDLIVMTTKNAYKIGEKIELS